jgi:hypothetical protein
LILFNGSKKLGGIVTLNCNEMEAAEMMLEANGFFRLLERYWRTPKGGI